MPATRSGTRRNSASAAGLDFNADPNRCQGRRPGRLIFEAGRGAYPPAIEPPASPHPTACPDLWPSATVWRRSGQQAKWGQRLKACPIGSPYVHSSFQGKTRPWPFRARCEAFHFLCLDDSYTRARGWSKAAPHLECAPGGGQFQAAVLSGCRVW
jgi:hypothetical protein